MYVVIEKMAHGLVRRWGSAHEAPNAAKCYEAAKRSWQERGYAILENIFGQAVILDETKAIGIIQIIPVN